MNNFTPYLFTAVAIERDDDCACPDRGFAVFFTAAQPEASHDCACPDKGMRVQVAKGRERFYVRSGGVFSVALPEGFQLAFSPYAPNGPSVLNRMAWERWQGFASPQPLETELDGQLVEQMLLFPAGTLPQTMATPPQTLTVWLHITNACSLDCPYCYVKKSSDRMSEPIGIQALETVFHTAQQHQFKRVKLKYAGGEATLHFKLVRRLHDYARQLSQQTGIQLKEVVLSNGVGLKAEDAQWMKAEGVKLMISLDGIGELHNRLRPLKNRAGVDTFQQVAHTIDNLLLPCGIQPDITMTVSGVNAHGAADVAKWALVERDLPLSFNFYRQNALSVSRKELEWEEQALINGMLAAYEVIERHLPIRPFLNGLLDRVQAEAHTHTCGVGQSYLVVTHTGQLAQCQMHLNSPVSPTITGDLLPMVAAGPLRNLSVELKEGCRHCEFRYRCSGGCPLETYRSTGRWDVQSPNCRIYKTLYPHALRLEGLRLLKLHGYIS